MFTLRGLLVEMGRSDSVETGPDCGGICATVPTAYRCSLRYRAIRSDRGSNLAATIAEAVNAAIGTNMLISKAHHHESAGSVERFNKTLIEMVRTVDPGGD